MTTDRELLVDGQSPTAVFALQGIDITPRKDQGVCKVVTRPGIEAERPMIGDKVFVHYTGKLLNGKKFDSSQDRKEPFTFRLGKGQVIKAWDIGVSTMRKGEVCLFLCKPEYAYGPAGSPPKIPPNSTLLFEVELLNFKGEELTEDGGILRRIKTKGEGFSNPNEGATVYVHLQGSCAGRVFDSRDVRFVVGESEDVGIPLGVDRAMEKMQKGECCLLYLKPKYGFGREGKSEFNIGPNAELVYEVTLKDFEKAKESWEMDLKEKLEMAVKVKQKGTQYFKVGRFCQAMIQYQRIVSWLEMECGVGVEQQQGVHAFLLVAQLNLALCHLRLGEYSQAVESCNKVIELDGENEKALYRRGEARLLRNEFSLAMDDFRHVLQVNPSNRAARSQISVCQRKIREHHERDKKIYANMFQKFAEHDAKVGRLKRRKEEGGSNENSELGAKRRHKSHECP
ncbi:peptidyl-prolyl cis-trans isomerase FKBP5 [Megalops cyprinoides]|uniref:peptidyl-prolyl cis-trans isomerase FKBP5 n=1 Tax=Megalops cyprinoides TaxID=118141 RepID=UPI001863A21E|nr:peptidyl-prolyl cis-trans isomerase FKBP5 [Megalops cyprinoides]